MLYTKTDSVKYKSEFKKRFTNFAQKAPILISFVISDEAVEVIHENTGSTHKFRWDYTIPVKSFIHAIKRILSDNHYPRITKVEVDKVELTAEEKADLIEKGMPLEEVPSHKEIKKSEIFKIDKVITLDDIFIIQSEETKKIYRYKMNYSCIFFLRNYREGDYKSLEEAGDFFFRKSELLGEII